MDAYWRAANYLSVGQIYLMNNPLLQHDLNMIFVTGSGHGGPSLVANTYLVEE
jgi:xylulose-5-phosphate/fructose-6-phosphate phosphoketolase